MAPDLSLPFLVLPEEPEADDEMGVFGRVAREGPLVEREIPVQRLRESLERIADSLGHVFSPQALPAVGNMPLREVVIQVEVSAEGGFRLIGTASVRGSGAIQLKFGEGG